MKKYLLSLSALLMGVVLFTSCEGDDTPQLRPVATSEGAFVMCTGNMGKKIQGSVSYWDYSKNSISNSVFSQANGRGLGSTPNDGICYGSKIYYVVDGESTIEVVDKSQKSIKQIKTTDLLGAAEGKSPRHIIAGDGAVWVTTYGGYVAAIDTATFALRKSYKVGSYPEGLVAVNGRVYVANSDFGKGKGSISEINLATGNVVEHKVEDIKNPQSIFITQMGMFILDWGSYDKNWNQIGAGLKVIKVKNGKDIAEDVVPNATSATYYNGMFYTINAPYGAASVSYSKYNVYKGAASPVAFNIDESKYSPSSIAVDPVTGRLFFSLYEKVGGFASYATEGYLKEFDHDGKELHSAKIGVGPSKIFFNTKVEWSK